MISLRVEISGFFRFFHRNQRMIRLDFLSLLFVSEIYITIGIRVYAELKANKRNIQHGRGDAAKAAEIKYAVAIWLAKNNQNTTNSENVL